MYNTIPVRSSSAIGRKTILYLRPGTSVSPHAIKYFICGIASRILNRLPVGFIQFRFQVLRVVRKRGFGKNPLYVFCVIDIVTTIFFRNQEVISLLQIKFSSHFDGQSNLALRRYLCDFHFCSPPRIHGIPIIPYLSIIRRSPFRFNTLIRLEWPVVSASPFIEITIFYYRSS